MSDVIFSNKKKIYKNVDPETLKKILNDDYDNLNSTKFNEEFNKWFELALKSVINIALYYHGFIITGLFYSLIMICTREFALPGSTSDKIKYHKEFQHTCKKYACYIVHLPL